MMRSIALATLVLSASLGAKELSDVSFYKETDHFIVSCDANDQEVSDLLLAEAEASYEKLQGEFRRDLTQKVRLNVYPDIDLFHQAMNWADAPPWIIGAFVAKANAVLVTSPNSPGPMHTYKSIFLSLMHNLTNLFLVETFGENYPMWLRVGTAMHKANQLCLIQKSLNALTTNHANVLSLDQLEAMSPKEFAMRAEYKLAYLFVDYIKEHWGCQTIIALFKDYSAFESILGVSKEEFLEGAIAHLDAHFSN